MQVGLPSIENPFENKTEDLINARIMTGTSALYYAPLNYSVGYKATDLNIHKE
jgi:hypothetical protein